MGGPRQVAKCMWVESSEPSEVDQEEATVGHQQPVDHHPTKVALHQELTDDGDAKEEMGLYSI